MKNNAAVRFAIGLIVLCLFADGVLSANAEQLSSDTELTSSKVKTAAYKTRESIAQDDFDDSPCKRFPKENVFNSFAKALRSPEKVRCLDPNFEGDDLNMKHLPPGLGNLVNLEVFSFGCLEQLEELPEEIGNLRKLEELIVDNGNGCSMNIRLPRSIGKLENLRVLRLYGAIDTPALPDTIGNLRKLEVLDIARNGLKIVPPQIARLSNLKTLRLEYNDLRRLPDFVGDFKNLKELSLDSNGRIIALPASVGKLKGLKISMGNDSLKLKDQQSLRARFPQIVFSFEDEYDDSAANESPKPKSKPRPKRKG